MKPRAWLHPSKPFSWGRGKKDISNRTEMECPNCFQVKPLSEFYRKTRSYCKVCTQSTKLWSIRSKKSGLPHSPRIRDYRIPEPKPDRKANARALSRYHHSGWVPDRLDLYWRLQGGACAICSARLINGGSGRGTLAADHEDTPSGKKQRGLLCHGCNQGLGHFRDEPDLLRHAAAYLEAWAG
jgi:hypothetical protein